MDAAAKWASVRELDVKAELKLGPNTLDRFIMDPKRLGFYSARYRVAAKLLRKCGHILDIGTGDGLFLTTFLQDTQASHILGIDFDEELIRYAHEQLMPAIDKARPIDWARINFMHADFMKGKFTEFDGIVCCDVLEHVPLSDADEFVVRIHDALNKDGLAVIGTPNKLASQYQSKHSEVGHIGLHDPSDLRIRLEKKFRHVWIISMNDEMAHFGFDGMAHYLMALAVK